MGYRLVVGAAVTLHYGFVLFLLAGGFLAWRWRRVVWWHGAAVVWVGLNTFGHVPCPLTWLESWGRRGAEEAPIPEGFVAHYLTGVVYPAGDVWAARGFVLLMLVVSWSGLYYLAHRPHPAASSATEPGSPPCPSPSHRPPSGG